MAFAPMAVAGFDEAMGQMYWAKAGLPIALLTLFWLWETWRPYFGWREGRWRHAAHNIALAVCNTIVLGLAFGTLTVLVADWTARHQAGLLNAFPFHDFAIESFALGTFALGDAARFAAALLLLDAWMYLWHRANHAVPLLWRFHRMHHSDNRMDVTTATRFHLGEHAGANVIRLGLVPLLGLHIWHIVVYDMLVIAVTQFHHADISLGRLDRWLRLLVVTPNMHKVHHSRWRPETDSNYSTVFSVWDRLARSFRMRTDPRTLQYGLDDYDEPRWQTFWGMWTTPFRSDKRNGLPKRSAESVNSPAEAMTCR